MEYENQKELIDVAAEYLKAVDASKLTAHNMALALKNLRDAAAENRLEESTIIPVFPHRGLLLSWTDDRYLVSEVDIVPRIFTEKIEWNMNHENEAQ